MKITLKPGATFTQKVKAGEIGWRITDGPFLDAAQNEYWLADQFFKRGIAGRLRKVVVWHTVLIRRQA